MASEKQSGLESRLDGEKLVGRVRKWDDVKGWGFIRHPDGDVFVRYDAIDMEGRKSLELGQPVEYILGTNSRPSSGNGMIAKYAKPLPVTSEVHEVPKETLDSRLGVPDKSKLLKGRVKLWSNKRGIGFIEHPDGDVFVHHKSIDQLGYRILTAGQEVEYVLGVNPEQKGNGMIATYVKPLPLTAEAHSIPREAVDLGLSVPDKSKLITGKVKFWDDKKGMGFIVHPDGDVFVHHRFIDQQGYRFLRTGQDVEYLLGTNTVQKGNGMMATYVKPCSPDFPTLKERP